MKKQGSCLRNWRQSMRKIRPVILFVTIVTAGFLVSVRQASADSLVLDRGLPTANLNNTAGSDRSNVAWADQEPSSNPSEYWLPGDDFTLTSNATVDDIRVWIVAAGTSSSGYLPTGLSLYGGTAGGAISEISTSYTSSSTTYANGQTYQGNDGSFWNIYQVDFAVDLNVSGGQTYDFFVDQPYVCGSTDSTGACTEYFNAFLSASNEALSGSPQQGADNTFLWLDVNGGTQTVETWNSSDGSGTAGFPAGWDKNSDANVQVFATPEPGSLLLLGTGLLGLAFVAFRRAKASGLTF